MPQFDKTGPRGEGPLTGRGLGPCKKIPVPNLGSWDGRPYSYPLGSGRGQGGMGRGLERGFGSGRGRGRFTPAR